MIAYNLKILQTIGLWKYLIKSSQNYPRANGLAEKGVEISKSMLKKANYTKKKLSYIYLTIKIPIKTYQYLDWVFYQLKCAIAI